VTSSASCPIVEIRVHGVNGGAPEDMLDDPFPVAVAGDDSARFLRRKGWEPTDPHIREAFHWGRFTSGSPLRALWLLLAPFAILNLATFTLLPTSHRRDRITWLVRAQLRLLGLVLTATLLLAVARTSMDLVMNQCAAAELCVNENRWLALVAWPHEGPRFVLGIAPPGIVIALLWWFGRQTFLYDPPGRPADKTFVDALGDRGFWHTGARAVPLRSAHVIAACALLGGFCLAYLGAAREGAAIDVTAWWGWGLIVFAPFLGVALVVVVVPEYFVDPGISKHATGKDQERDEGEEGTRQQPLPDRWRAWTMAKALRRVQQVALGILLAAGAFGAIATWEASPPAIVGEGAPGRAPLPGFEDAAVVTLLVLGGLLFFLAITCVVLRSRYAPSATLPRSFRPLWWGFAPVVLAALAVTLAGGFSGGLVFWVGNVLGRIAPETSPLDPASPTDPRFEWPILLGPSYFITGLVSSILVIALAVVLPALAASLLRTGPTAPWMLLAAGLAAGGAILLAGQAAMWWLIGAAVSLGGAGGFAWRRAWKREDLQKLVAYDYPVPTDPDLATIAPTTESDTIRKIAAQWRLARTKYRFHWLLGTVAVLGGLGVIAAAILCVSRVNPGPIGVSAAGPLLLSGVAATFVALGLRSWGNQKLRVTVGILWDLLAFWPRSAHPLCPPPYGGRAVLELARRAKDIATTAPRPRVVLAGHSQGSLVCLAAVAVLDMEREDGKHSGAEFIRAEAAKATLPSLSLVTFGSQLQWAYARLFPRYVGYDMLSTTFDKILQTRWRNLHRWTDPLGGPVLTWPDDRQPTPAGLEDAKQVWRSVEDKATTPKACRVGRPDDRLLDPLRITTMPHQVRAPLLGHSDYFADVDAYEAAVRAVVYSPTERPADMGEGGHDRL
jgi:hypothetical protein